MTTEPTGSTSTSDRYVRITTSGKIKSWVSFALEALEVLEDNDAPRALIFHTLPSSVDPTTLLNDKGGTKRSQLTRQAASNTLSTTSRLISVVEIIKREYIKKLEEKRSSRLCGLYQYNEIGTLEEFGFSIAPSSQGGSELSPEGVESSRIIEALSGKNHTRVCQSPFMRVTLSTTERQDLIQKGATFQPPYVRKLSKTAKARARKRNKKLEAEKINKPSEPSTEINAPEDSS